MKTIIRAAAIAAAFAADPAGATTTTSAIAPPMVAAPAAGSVFADLAAFGYDLGKFRPDYSGRFPYR